MIETLFVFIITKLLINNVLFRFSADYFLKFVVTVLCIYLIAVLYARSYYLKIFIRIILSLCLVFLGILPCIYFWSTQPMFRRFWKVLYISAGMFIVFVIMIFSIVGIYLWAGRRITKLIRN